MRLLMLGAGGIGGYFGGRVAAGGGDVTFLVRPARAERIAAEGLKIFSPHGDVVLKPQTITEARDPFDAVLLSCKAYDLDSAIQAITPAVGPDTLVVPLLNGLRHYGALDARFGAERVAGGLAHIPVTLKPDGSIVHMGPLQRLIVGLRSKGQRVRCEALHAALEPGGFRPILSQTIEQAMWDKYVMLAAFAGLTCLMRAPVGAIMQARDGEAIAEGFLAECAAVAEATGRRPTDKALGEARALMTTKGSSATASMLRDLEGGGRTEHDHLLGDMLERARGAGIAAPLLTVAFAHMQAQEARREAG
ncbi:2-dehydropantoate 2-reductase [Chelatococcus sambhunathii]|uniref:2-dehydropantoate 2-reductase n=1 Tax=Chelatococcus sambhunathii TaxID=363953 RepID=A0ABU1DDP5_9HYPH|nr:2-dehydropantoate 2-reductase [Chelatococcus sambhunathii]MDR4306237.1 2-dehydropantoate 2-reductase [Chelatococcus sambhunathii]